MIEAMKREEADLFWEKVHYRCSGDFTGIRETKDGVLRAMVVFDRWSENFAEMHVWVGDPRVFEGNTFLREIFNYLFVTCGRGIAIAVTPAHNTVSLKFQKGLGFTETFRIKDGWAIGDDMVIAELRKDDCLWIRPHGTHVTTRTAVCRDAEEGSRAKPDDDRQHQRPRRRDEAVSQQCFDFGSGGDADRE